MWFACPASITANHVRFKIYPVIPECPIAMRSLINAAEIIIGTGIIGMESEILCSCAIIVQGIYRYRCIAYVVGNLYISQLPGTVGKQVRNITVIIFFARTAEQINGS